MQHDQGYSKAALLFKLMLPGFTIMNIDQVSIVQYIEKRMNRHAVQYGSGLVIQRNFELDDVPCFWVSRHEWCEEIKSTANNRGVKLLSDIEKPTRLDSNLLTTLSLITGDLWNNREFAQSYKLFFKQVLNWLEDHLWATRVNLSDDFWHFYPALIIGEMIELRIDQSHDEVSLSPNGIWVAGTLLSWIFEPGVEEFLCQMEEMNTKQKFDFHISKRECMKNVIRLNRKGEFNDTFPALHEWYKLQC